MSSSGSCLPSMGALSSSLAACLDAGVADANASRAQPGHSVLRPSRCCAEGATLPTAVVLDERVDQRVAHYLVTLKVEDLKHGWSILNSICNLPLVFLRIMSSAQFFSKRLQQVPSSLETCRSVRWDLPRENPVRAGICIPRPEIFCCKLTLSLISPR